MESLAFTRQVPVVRDCDVLVVGGGPAGIAASIAAARNGARTILVERYGFLGGTATNALVGPFMTSYSLDGKVQLVRGIFDELVRRMESIGGATHPSSVEDGNAYSSYITVGHKHVTPHHSEALKLVAAEMCLEAGVELRLHSWLVEPILSDDGVTGVIVGSKSGLQGIRARATVDCTGDADVAFMAGAPTVKGREQDGRMQPMSTFFRLANVDRARVDAYKREHPDEPHPFEDIVRAARDRGEFPVPRVTLNAYLEHDGWAWRMNVSRLIGFDGTDVEDLTRAEIEGRRQVHFLVDFFRKHAPGFERCVLVESGAQVGVRETRRIVGEYVLTVEDLGRGTVFDDAIAFAGFPVDIHQVDGAGGTVVGFGGRGKYPIADAYAIPYRSLVPRRVEQLLVAGRAVSATHEAAGAVRVMPPCFAMGQAAGTAAALATAGKVQPRRVDVKLLQRTLLAQGTYLGPISSADVSA